MLKETVTNEEILEVENRGQLWNNCDYQTLKLGGHWYVLNEHGWNGEKYYDCWEVEDSDGLEAVDLNVRYAITPVDEELEEYEFECIGYIIDKQ